MPYRRPNNPNTDLLRIKHQAAQVDAILKWGWCFADKICEELQISRATLGRVIAFMRYEERKDIYTVGYGESLAYEYAEPFEDARRVPAAQQSHRAKHIREPFG